MKGALTHHIHLEFAIPFVPRLFLIAQLSICCEKTVFHLPMFLTKCGLTHDFQVCAYVCADLEGPFSCICVL